MPTLKFSVIVPTCRREEHLGRLLESLRPGVQIADPATYEVIVSDDARGKTSEAMVREKFPWVIWLLGPGRGPASNRNNAVRQARGEWVCFIDDDCEASKQWISELDKATQDPAFDMIEGQTSMPFKPDSPFEHGITNETGKMYWTCNLTVRRSTFESLGEFDEDFLEPAGEDVEFAFRFHAHHYRSKFSRESLVWHPARRVGWGTIWHRVLMLRWGALTSYKTGQGLSLSKSPAQNVRGAAVGFVMNLLRRTVRDARRWRAPYWRDRGFAAAVRWVTFPFSFPWYLYWVYRFHIEQTAKGTGTRENAGRSGQVYHQKVEKVVHHRTLFQFVPKFVQRALHPLWRQFYYVDYVLPDTAEVHTLVDYLPNEPMRKSSAIENIRVLAPSEKIVIAPPSDPFIAAGKYYPEGTFIRPAIVVCDVPDARVHIGTGFVCTRDWEVLPDMEYRLTDYPEIRNWKSRNVTRRTGTFSTVFSWNAGNFAHWLLDFMPRLHLLEKAEPTAKITLVMPDFIRPTLRESLEILLPKNFTLEYHPQDTWFQTEKFLWATVVSGRCNFFLPAESFEALRRPIFAKYGLPEKHTKKRRIFVTRRHATTRRVLNEPEVSALLTRYGFEGIELSELSFRQQVELFHEADIVVGPHGAGLASITFSGDIKLVVFYATQLPLNHWHTLARGLGQEHYFLMSNVGEDDSFSVDVPGLEAILRDQLGLKPL